jgi:hypothetical protein
MERHADYNSSRLQELAAAGRGNGDGGICDNDPSFDQE